MIALTRKRGRRVANKVVKNFALDQELVDALMRKSVARSESMSLIVREALRNHLASEQQVQIGASK